MATTATDILESRILLYYCFTPIEDPVAVMLWQRTLCEQLGLTGLQADGPVNGGLRALGGIQPQILDAVLVAAAVKDLSCVAK